MSIVQGFEDFVLNIVHHDQEVELLRAFTVEGEPTHFSFELVASRLVPVVFRPSGAELDDVISFEFIFELSQVLAQRRLVLARLLSKNDGIGVEVHDALVESLKFLVEFESGVASGETGNEDVEVGGYFNHVLVDFVVDFDAVFGQRADISDVVASTSQESVQGLRVGELFHVGFVEALTKFTPHGIEHEFGDRTTSLVDADVVFVQLNPFVLEVVL